MREFSALSGVRGPSCLPVMSENSDGGVRRASYAYEFHPTRRYARNLKKGGTFALAKR